MKVRKAVFPAAGLGTRFLPATKAQPKEMLPLVDKPIIQYGVEEAMASGCDQIIIITGRGKQAIEDHFDVSYELEHMLEERGKTDLLKIVRSISDMIHVAYVRQKEALGLGHAILTARELVGDEPFAVLLADDVIDAKVPCLKQMIEVFNEKQCSVIATQVIEGADDFFLRRDQNQAGRGIQRAALRSPRHGRETEARRCAIESRGDRPLHSHSAVFETLASITPGAGGELQLTDGLRHAAEERKNVRLRLRRPPPRCRRQTRLPESTVEFALKREDLGGPFREYLKGLKL